MMMIFCDIFSAYNVVMY